MTNKSKKNLTYWVFSLIGWLYALAQGQDKPPMEKHGCGVFIQGIVMAVVFLIVVLVVIAAIPTEGVSPIG